MIISSSLSAAPLHLPCSFLLCVLAKRSRTQNSIASSQGASMETTASLHFSQSPFFSLKAGFSDQSHLVFYGGSSTVHSRPLKTHLYPKMTCSATRRPLTALSTGHLLPSEPSTCTNVPRNAAASALESDLHQELATLKAQVKLKKKQLKAMAKEKKAALKGKKSKAKCESSSSSSESCGEGSMSINTRLWKKCLPSMGDQEASLGAVSEIHEPHGLKEDADQAYVRPNPVESSLLVPSGGTLNGFSFKSCTQNPWPISKPAQRIIAGAEHAISMPTRGSSHMSASAGSVEVCVGGKCKRAGSQQLLSSLRSQIPLSANVEAMPCKCMGKCASAINVRVQKEDTNLQHHSHVGVDDTGFILSRHFGLGPPASGLPHLPSLTPPNHRVQTAKA